MELKVNGKFVTSSKVKKFQNPFCHILEMINKTYVLQKYLHDAFKIYRAPKLYNVK